MQSLKNGLVPLSKSDSSIYIDCFYYPDTAGILNDKFKNWSTSDNPPDGTKLFKSIGYN